MAFDTEDRRKKNYVLRRSIGDLGRGAVIALVGIFFVFADQFGFYFTIEPVFRYCLAGLFIIYGAFRVYRGYQKNYYREE